MRPISILGIAGSLRRGSYNGLLLRAAAEHAPQGMTIDVYSDLASVPLFNEELESENGPQAVVRLRQRVHHADGVLIATPEYNQSIPGVLKNAIDWLSRPPEEVLDGKAVAIIGASTGRWGTRLAQAAVRQTLNAAEAVVLPSPAVFIGEASSVFDSAGHLTNAPICAALEALLIAFQRWIDMVTAK